MIEYFDNVFSIDKNIEIHEQLHKPRWRFDGGGTSDDGQTTSHFWHVNNLENDEYFINLFDEISPTFFSNQEVSIVRCYANGQSAGQTGLPHTDDGDVTLLYFPTVWKHYYGGHLNFCDDNNITSVIEYKQNRMVKFDAKLKHYSNAPINTYTGLRLSLAFKVRIHE